jgi:acyl-coenzyme A thioesterase PaaI-like protein
MTDVPRLATSIPSRLNVTVPQVDPLVLRLVPLAETCRLGSVRASALSFVIDAVAGVTVDSDPDHWTFTSDMSVRMNPVPAPDLVDGTAAVLRRGKRSATTEARLVDAHGSLVAFGSLGFAHVPRRPTDPEKITFDALGAAEAWGRIAPIDTPLPEAAGIEVIDGASGIVQVEITEDLRNPAGAMQGAMVALVAEVAAEEMISARWGRPALVCDLDIRYLTQSRIGPVRTRSEWLGDGDDAWVRVELVDESNGQLLTHVLARARESTA